MCAPPTSRRGYREADSHDRVASRGAPGESVNDMYLAGKTEAEQERIKAAMARAVGMGGKPNL